jgi:hypothetical protein
MPNQTLKYKSIFCLEGEWNSTNLKEKTSVKPFFNFMEETFGIHHVFRKVNSRESFFKYLDLLARYSGSKYKSYGILYLAFHGEKNCIYLDDGDLISMDEILEKGGSALKNRIIHFGSCNTLRISDSLLSEFYQTSQAKAVSGFSKTIDFLDSSLFDIAYLTKLTEYKRT